MAVVFISPKQRQRVFFLGITIVLLLLLILIFSGVFLSNPSEVSLVLVFNKPKVTYNIINDLDSDVFNLFQVIMNQKEELEKAFYLMPIHSDLLDYWKKNNEKILKNKNEPNFIDVFRLWHVPNFFQATADRSG